MARLLDIILDLVMVAVVARTLAIAFQRFFRGVHSPHTAASPRQEANHKTVEGETVRDPVCGIFVSTELAHRLEWHGKTFYFCSEECRQKFRKSGAAKNSA